MILVAAAGPGGAVVPNAGDILVVDSEQAEVILVDPVGGGQTVVAFGIAVVPPSPLSPPAACGAGCRVRAGLRG